MSKFNLEERMLQSMSLEEMLCEIESTSGMVGPNMWNAFEERLQSYTYGSNELSSIKDRLTKASRSTTVVDAMLRDAWKREHAAGVAKYRRELLAILTQLNSEAHVTELCDEAHRDGFAEVWTHYGWGVSKENRRQGHAQMRSEMDHVEAVCAAAKDAWDKAPRSAPQLPTHALEDALAARRNYVKALRVRARLEGRMQALEVLLGTSEYGANPLRLARMMHDGLKEAAQNGQSMVYAASKIVGAPKPAQWARDVVETASKRRWETYVEFAEVVARTLNGHAQLQACGLGNVSWNKTLLMFADPNGGPRVVGVEVLPEPTICVRRVRASHKQKALEAWSVVTPHPTHTLEGALTLAIAANVKVWRASL